MLRSAFLLAGFAAALLGGQAIAQVDGRPQTPTPRSTLGAAAGLPTVVEAASTPRWKTLPSPPPLPRPASTGRAEVDGISMYYATFGRGRPILLIHNGVGSADDWGGVVPLLARHNRVIVADTRGYGRSTRNSEPYSYGLLARDYVGLLDHLGIKKAFLAGSSDGAIISLDIAIHHPERVSGLFLQGANISPDGFDSQPQELAAIRLALARWPTEYRRLSSTPDDFAAFRAAVGAMPQPSYSLAELASIRAPTTVAIPDHEESVKRSHSDLIAATIPGARTVMLEAVSHFAPLQDPQGFAKAVERALVGDVRRAPKG